MRNGQYLQLSNLLGYYAMMTVNNKRLGRTSQMTQTSISVSVTTANLVIIKKLFMRSFPVRKVKKLSQILNRQSYGHFKEYNLMGPKSS
jgi:hypothetical protein